MFTTQQLIPFCSENTVYYPDLVREFYNTLTIDSNNNAFAIVKGITISVSLSKFIQILSLPSIELPIFHDSAVNKAHALQLMSGRVYPESIDLRTLNANTFPPFQRVLHKIFTSLLFPKVGSHDRVLLEHLFLFQKFFDKEPFSYGHLFYTHLFACKDNIRRSLPFAAHLTKLFEHSKIILNGEKKMTSHEVFDLKKIAQMGFQVKDGTVLRKTEVKSPICVTPTAAPPEVPSPHHVQVDSAQEPPSASEPVPSTPPYVPPTSYGSPTQMAQAGPSTVTTSLDLSEELKTFMERQFSLLKSVMLGRFVSMDLAINALSEKQKSIEERQVIMNEKLDSLPDSINQVLIKQNSLENSQRGLEDKMDIVLDKFGFLKLYAKGVENQMESLNTFSQEASKDLQKVSEGITILGSVTQKLINIQEGVQSKNKEILEKQVQTISDIGTSRTRLISIAEDLRGVNREVIKLPPLVRTITRTQESMATQLTELKGEVAHLKPKPSAPPKAEDEDKSKDHS